MVPVGWPMPQTQALVLAESGRLCGVGEPGEIYLRTPFRSLGYLDALEESRARFVANPFRADERDMLYRTGDLGRYRPDGSLEVLGRLDFQIKIRGVRVEPDEVTAILARHPQVKACIVVGAKKDLGESRLVAYVVAPEPNRPTGAELRAYLGEGLPAVMVPSAFVFLDELPRTSNGKVDRRVLPEPAAIPSDSGAEALARSPIEEIVAGIWERALGSERIGLNESFFDLGGHSLLAAQVISRWGVFQRDVPLRDLRGADDPRPRRPHRGSPRLGKRGDDPDPAGCSRPRGRGCRSPSPSSGSG